MVHPILLSILLTFSSLSWASEKDYHPEDKDLWQAIPSAEIEVGEESLPFKKIASKNSNRLYIWFNETYPANNGDAILNKTLSETGEVWYFDLAEALFMPRSRTDFRNLSGDFMPAIMQRALQENKEIVLLTSDVTSVPLLRGLRLWQQTANQAERERLVSVVLLFPSLYVNTPAAGEERQLFPIASETSLPIVIIQPELGAQATTISESMNALISGGSLVKLFRYPEGADGYYRYQKIREMSHMTGLLIPDLVKKQQKMAKQMGFNIPQTQPLAKLQNPPKSTLISGMKKIDPPVPMPNILLEDLYKNKVNLHQDYQGKALLVNFWATWCPHCVEEIPSMNNALRQLKKDNFEIVSISYMDTYPIMQEFVKEIPVDFPILMDLDGQVSKQWKVFAFPSSFLVDENGLIRYSINAGNIWDTPEMLDYLKQITQPLADDSRP